LQLHALELFVFSGRPDRTDHFSENHGGSCQDDSKDWPPKDSSSPKNAATVAA
jgi:hypothetical protein